MKIYVSCVRGDREYADQIIENLKTVNPEWKFIAYHTEEKLGDDYRQAVSKNIRDADAVILIISSNYNGNRYGWLELDWTLAYYYEHHSPALLPIILDDAQVPHDIQQFVFFHANTHCEGGNSLKDISNKLAETLSPLEIQKRETKVISFAKRLNKNGSVYIQETKERLNKQAGNNKALAFICYAACFILLCLCAILCWSKMDLVQDTLHDTVSLILFGISGLTILSLLIAAARFAFVLGKSFMVEAIRNMDRIHAIDFGDFYLKLFEEQFEWTELKEILQNWNIDKGSAFISQDAKDIDPAVLNAFVEFAKNFRNE